jgi:hypothetical protein
LKPRGESSTIQCGKHGKAQPSKFSADFLGEARPQSDQLGADSQTWLIRVIPMITRRTATAIGNAYMARFSWRGKGAEVYKDALYEFMFNHACPAWLCNLAKKLRWPIEVKEFFMKLHTGETQSVATPNWSWAQRENLGQQYLRQTAEDFLNDGADGLAQYSVNSNYEEPAQAMRQSLEFDGYAYTNRRLHAPESDVLDVREVVGVLESLYGDLGLARKDVALHCLKLSEDHWLGGRWDDCISNARRFLESVMQEVASGHSMIGKRVALAQNVYDRPVEIRKYLEAEGLLETKEAKAIAEVYGLLSNTGSHPYIAAKDQARLLRQQALILSQFVLLRYQGYLASNC